MCVYLWVYNFVVDDTRPHSLRDEPLTFHIEFEKALKLLK